MDEPRKRRSFDLEMVKKKASELNGKCLSEKYINSTYRLLFECGEGHKFKLTPLEIMGKKSKPGKWCPNVRSQLKKRKY